MKRVFALVGILMVLAVLLLLTGCMSGFETEEEAAYRTERIEGVVVKSAEEAQMQTGRPQPTATPAPPLKEQYDIPEIATFNFESGKLTVTGTAQVVAPEGNAMAAYTLTPGGFTQETVDAIFAACCGTTPMYGGFSEPYSKGELAKMVQGLKAAALLKEDKELEKDAKALQKQIENAPEAVQREQNRGQLKQQGTYTATYCASLPEELGLVFEASNLPLWEEGEAQWSLTGDMARVLFYRNKAGLKSVYGLRINHERNGAKLVEGTEAEKLKQQGEAFLAKAGLEETFSVGHMSKMELANGDTLYLIDYQRLVGGISVMENFGFSDIMEVHDIWPLEGMRLGIDGEGICFFCWEAPLAVGDEVKLGEMLPFPVIQQTMITLLKERYGKTDTGCTLEVKRVELCYRPQYTEEKGAVLVPVWNLLGTQNGGERERTLLSVNALTGEQMPSRSWRGKR